QSLVPAGAVTVRLMNSPFLPLPVTPESPGLSTFGGVCCPTPSSRNGNFGGASLFGLAPCAFPSASQIRHFTTCRPVFGASDFLTIVNVCGPSSAARLTTWIVPPEGTLYTSLSQRRLSWMYRLTDISGGFVTALTVVTVARALLLAATATVVATAATAPAANKKRSFLEIIGSFPGPRSCAAPSRV